MRYLVKPIQLVLDNTVIVAATHHEILLMTKHFTLQVVFHKYYFSNGILFAIYSALLCGTASVLICLRFDWLMEFSVQECGLREHQPVRRACTGAISSFGSCFCHRARPHGRALRGRAARHATRALQSR